MHISYRRAQFYTGHPPCTHICHFFSWLCQRIHERFQAHNLKLTPVRTYADVRAHPSPPFNVYTNTLRDARTDAQSPRWDLLAKATFPFLSFHRFVQTLLQFLTPNPSHVVPIRLPPHPQLQQQQKQQQGDGETNPLYVVDKTKRTTCMVRKANEVCIQAGTDRCTLVCRPTNIQTHTHKSTVRRNTYGHTKRISKHTNAN